MTTLKAIGTGRVWLGVIASSLIPAVLPAFWAFSTWRQMRQVTDEWDHHVLAKELTIAISVVPVTLVFACLVWGVIFLFLRRAEFRALTVLAWMTGIWTVVGAVAIGHVLTAIASGLLGAVVAAVFCLVAGVPWRRF
ncbi:MAG TPA: hypothetical protein VHZ78_03745 [Rhizomicrobium sp.]|jgi:hypothetical protein|nr:hypothetical protein [Rhizomicrobium sp.]